MDEYVVNSRSELSDRISAGDPDAINAVLGGYVKTAVNEPEKDVVELQTEETEKSVVQQDQSTENVETDSESERLAKYRKLIEQEKDVEKNRALAEKEAEIARKEREYQDRLAKQEIARQEAEKRLEELQKQQSFNNPVHSDEEEEEEVYASEYSKKTRQIVEELKASQKNSLADDPKIQSLIKKLEVYDKEIENKRKEEEERRVKQAEEEHTRKLANEIRVFQDEYPELKTKMPIETISEHYNQFRKDLAILTKANSIVQLEHFIQDYVQGGATKELAEQHGVVIPDEYDKFLKIIELDEYRRGEKFNPSTGNNEPIYDSYGNKVRYRNLEEVYIIQNRNNQFNGIREAVTKDFEKKLTTLNQSAVTLDNNDTAYIGNEIVPATEIELMNLPPQDILRDPNKLKQLKLIYDKKGITAPKYRGKEMW
jgi:hypothetical protein